AVSIDPLARSHGFALARRLVGLTPPTAADQLVAQVEAAYLSQDVAQIMPLLHPDIVIYWNGHKVAEGREAARNFHTGRLGFGSRARADFRLTKNLRAAQDDTIAVESESRYRADDGRLVHGKAGEFWTMRYGLIIEWHAYHHRLTDDQTEDATDGPVGDGRGPR
ncbi:MAG: nuclear transport factor 2 family protein, partial [Ilumatobacteraceae bacterium]